MLRKKLPHQPRPNDPWAQDMGWLTKRLRQAAPKVDSTSARSHPEVSQSQRHMRSVMEEPSIEQPKRKNDEKENERCGNAAEAEKVDLLSCKLQQLYLHYRQEESHLEQMQSKIEETKTLKAQNDNLEKEIQSIRNMLKEVLLNRERGRVGKTG